MLTYELFFDPDLSIILNAFPANDGVRYVLEHLDDFRRKGVGIQERNTAKMSATELEHSYIRAIVPSVYRKYKVRRMFGSNRKSGWLFGRHVPALLVSDPSGKTPGDVYPHDAAGRIVTIHDFLTTCVPDAMRTLTQS
jgi:hypothetical protein